MRSLPNITNRKTIDLSYIEHASELNTFDNGMRRFIKECFDFHNAYVLEGEHKYRLKDSVQSIWDDGGFVPQTKSLGTSFRVTKGGEIINHTNNSDMSSGIMLKKLLKKTAAKLDKQIKVYKNEGALPASFEFGGELENVRKEAEGYLNIIICMKIRALELLPENIAFQW